MQSYIERAVRAIMVATFFVPLVMLPASFIFPFIVPKIVVFRSLILLMLGGFITLLSAAPHEYRIRKSPISIAVLLYLCGFAISTFVGVDPYHSFWDNHERMLGLFTIVHYILYYVILTSVVKEWRQWRFLLRCFLFAGSIVMFIGVLQRFVNPTLLLNQSGSRVAATLGNPIYVGGYGLFLAFLGWLLYMREDERVWKVYAAIGGVLGFFGIFLSGTRGSMLGILSGLGVAAVAYFFTLKNQPKVRKILMIAAIAGIALLGVLFVFRKTHFVERIPALGPLLNTTLGTGTANTRIMAWGVAVDAWKEKPIFGWGPNNFYYAFNKYYRPEFLRHGWGETWFDNAHNIILNTLAVQGAAGLLVYLGLFGTVFATLWSAYRTRRIDTHTCIIAAAFFTAHLAQNVFVFENPTSYLYFFFMLAFVNAISLPMEEKPFAAPQKPSLGLGIIVGLLVLVIIYSTNINAARANRSTLVLLRSLYANQDPVGQFERTIVMPSPHIDDIRSDFGRIVIQVVPEYITHGETERAKQLIALADQEFQKNRELHPFDIRTHLQQSQLAELAASSFQNIDYLLASEKALTDALALSPRRQQVQYTLAAVKLALRKYDEAIEIMEQAVANDPTIGEGWWRLAVFYQEAGQPDKAKETVREARRIGPKLDEHGRNVLNQILPAEAATGTAP